MFTLQKDVILSNYIPCSEHEGEYGSGKEGNCIFEENATIFGKIKNEKK
jgi:hypothetical protein